MTETTPFEIKIGVGGAGSQLDNQRASDGGTTVFNSIGTFFPSAGGTYQISAGGGGGGGSDSGGGGNVSGNGNPGLSSGTTMEGNLNIISRMDGSGGGASHPINKDAIGLNKNGGDGSTHSGGGGGEASSPGSNGNTSEQGGNGGSGIQFNLFDTRRARIIGGGGGGGSDANHIALGGSNVGGNGGYNGPGQNGKTPGSGGGGGGHSGDESGGKGASGVLFVKYEILKILPVEFLDLEAVFSELSREARLFWTTPQSKAGAHYEIHRSVSDIQNWRTIGKIDPKEYTKEPFTYEFFDKNLPASGGTVFYRISQVDEVGNSIFSETRAIRLEPVAGSRSWVIYPNPTDGSSFVLERLDSSSYDEWGVQAILSTTPGQNEHFTGLTIEHLSQKLWNALQTKTSGIYILTLRWAGKTESYRIIKN